MLKANPDTRRFLFPVNSNGNRDVSVEPKHWTLLVFDTETGDWTHYNSMKSHKTEYLADAALIVSVTYIIHLLHISQTNILHQTILH